jgi:penicillin-binding protein 1A
MPRLPRLLRWILLGSVTLALLAAIAVGILVYVVSARLPDVQSLRDIQLQEPMYVYARDGRLIGLFGEMRRYPVNIRDVPPRVKQAFLAAEDANFYQHHGVDFTGVARAGPPSPSRSPSSFSSAPNTASAANSQKCCWQ